MKVVVFGATGKTGTEIVNQALAKNHEVTAFARDPSRLTLENETESAEDRLRLVSGDVFDISAVKHAVEGQEAVICSLGSNSLGKTAVRGEGTANIIKAMEEGHVDRLLVVSAMGTGESWSSLSFTNKFFYATLLRSSRQDHEAQETAVKRSNLDWTILRPSGLTDGAMTGTYALGENIKGESSRIARADVAHAIIKELDEKAFVRMAVTITN
jgi:putative NADH-flavin reductase